MLMVLLGSIKKSEGAVPKMPRLDLKTKFRSIAQASRPRDQRGQGLVEYGLIVTLVGLVLVAVLLTMSGALNTVFYTAVNTFNAATT